MGEIVRDYIDSRFHWKDDSIFHHENNEKHVEWKGNQVDIPKIGYNAGGKHTDYTPEKVYSTLDFFYFQLKKKTNESLIEIRDEMLEEMHAPSLLEIAAKASVNDYGTGIYEHSEGLLKLFGIQVEQKIDTQKLK